MKDKKRLFDAIEYAAQVHSGQFRKGVEVPFIIHPLRVAERLIRSGCSEELAIAAVLHDVVEDTSAELPDIRKRFGERIANLVDGASEPDKSLHWKVRKENTIEYLSTANKDELILSLADKLDNLYSIKQDIEQFGSYVWERFNSSRDDQKWYYESLRDIYANHPGIKNLSMFAEYDALCNEIFAEVTV